MHFILTERIQILNTIATIATYMIYTCRRFLQNHRRKFLWIHGSSVRQFLYSDATTGTSA